MIENCLCTRVQNLSLSSHVGRCRQLSGKLSSKEINTGPSPGFSSREGQKPEGGDINQKGGHIFNIQYWMYAATGGPNVKVGSTDFKWGTGHHWPPRWRRPWRNSKSKVWNQLIVRPVASGRLLCIVSVYRNKNVLHLYTSGRFFHMGISNSCSETCQEFWPGHQPRCSESAKELVMSTPACLSPAINFCQFTLQI